MHRGVLIRQVKIGLSLCQFALTLTPLIPFVSHSPTHTPAQTPVICLHSPASSAIYSRLWWCEQLTYSELCQPPVPSSEQYITTKATYLTHSLLKSPFPSALQDLISPVRLSCDTTDRVQAVVGEGGMGRGWIFHNKHIGRQPPFLANLCALLPACPAPGALPETDGSRNVLERSF